MSSFTIAYWPFSSGGLTKKDRARRYRWRLSTPFADDAPSMSSEAANSAIRAG